MYKLAKTLLSSFSSGLIISSIIENILCTNSKKKSMKHMNCNTNKQVYETNKIYISLI